MKPTAMEIIEQALNPIPKVSPGGGAKNQRWQAIQDTMPFVKCAKCGKKGYMYCISGSGNNSRVGQTYSLKIQHGQGVGEHCFVGTIHEDESLPANVKDIIAKSKALPRLPYLDKARELFAQQRRLEGQKYVQQAIDEIKPEQPKLIQCAGCGTNARSMIEEIYYKSATEKQRFGIFTHDGGQCRVKL